jgi:hypothetical protein
VILVECDGGVAVLRGGGGTRGVQQWRRVWRREQEREFIVIGDAEPEGGKQWRKTGKFGVALVSPRVGDA